MACENVGEELFLDLLDDCIGSEESDGAKFKVRMEDVVEVLKDHDLDMTPLTEVRPMLEKRLQLPTGSLETDDQKTRASKLVRTLMRQKQNDTCETAARPKKQKEGLVCNANAKHTQDQFFAKHTWSNGEEVPRSQDEMVELVKQRVQLLNAIKYIGRKRDPKEKIDVGRSIKASEDPHR